MSRSSVARALEQWANEEESTASLAGAHDRPYVGFPVDTAVARRFYCGVLCGRQVWPSERVPGRELWFQVGESFVAVRLHRHVVTPALLVVDDPTEVAGRCWDAGFTVRVCEGASEEMTFVVTDPFGRRLFLVSRGSATIPSLVLCEEPR